MFDFIMSQINYTGTALTQAQLEMMVFCACIFLVFIFSILAAYFMVEFIKFLVGGFKR